MPYVYLDKRKKPHIWRFQYTDHLGRRRSGTGTTSKAETEEIAAIAQSKERAICRNWATAPKSADLAKHKPFGDAKAEYLAWGRSQGGIGGAAWSTEHAEKRESGLDWWEEQLGLKVLGDLPGILRRVESALRDFQAKGKAVLTVRHRADCLRSFCKWAVQRGYLAEDPIKGMSAFEKKAKTVRRAMTVEEIHKLLEVAPPHRRLVYLVALASGLRAGELQALRVADLDAERGGLKLHSEWTKNRKSGLQPLPMAVVVMLARSSKDKPADAPLLQINALHGHAARDFHKDREKADIAYKVLGQKVDFHALRVAYTTFVIESGADIKTAQTLARHSTPDLTLNVYARARSEKLVEVAEAVGKAILPPESTPLAYSLAAGAEAVDVNAADAIASEVSGSDLAGAHGNRTHQSPLRRTQRL